jgi:hypothetical protein
MIAVPSSLWCRNLPWKMQMHGQLYSQQRTRPDPMSLSMGDGAVVFRAARLADRDRMTEVNATKESFALTRDVRRNAHLVHIVSTSSLCRCEILQNKLSGIIHPDDDSVVGRP